METKSKAVITAPFADLKPGVKYNYTRKTWPAPQAGTKHTELNHTAVAKEFPKVTEKGEIINVLRVQLDGKGRHYTLSELPADATLTEQ